MLDLGQFYTQTWLDGPFGSPDAARLDAMESYIQIAGVTSPIAERALQHRFVVGRKGAGKTHYLLALQQTLKQRRRHLETSDIFVFRQIGRIATDLVIEINRAARRYYTNFVATADSYVDPYFHQKEFWTRLWDRAVLLSVFSMYFASRREESEITIAVEKSKYSNWAPIIDKLTQTFPETAAVRSPVEMLNVLFNETARRKFPALRRKLNEPIWDEVRKLLNVVAKDTPPIAVIIDAVDDDFEQAPEAWLRCQEGLFRALVGLLNEGTQLSNRVHVIVALRDIVFSSLLRTEHANRLLGDSHILQIRWDYASAREFLEKKLNKIFSSRGSTLTHGDLVTKWLGCPTVWNVTRKRMESTREYLLRHTRMLPRDIVILGNALSSAPVDQDAEKHIKRITSDVARSIAREAIYSVVNEALASNDYLAELFLSERDHHLEEAAMARGGDAGGRGLHVHMRELVLGKIDDFFSYLGTEKFTQTSLKEAVIASGLEREESFRALDGNIYRFDHILWRHGLIACRRRRDDDHEWRFCNHGIAEDLLLPSDESLYGVHSCMLDLYTRLKVSSDGPVFS